MHEDSQKRYLTGSDSTPKASRSSATPSGSATIRPLHPEGRQVGQDPRVFDTIADGKPVRSPDNWAAATPGAPGATYTNVNLRRSKGYEGFAARKRRQIPLRPARGTVVDAEKKDWEKVDGKEAARILEFDVAAEKFTGAIGNMCSSRTAMPSATST